MVEMQQAMFSAPMPASTPFGDFVAAPPASGAMSNPFMQQAQPHQAPVVTAKPPTADPFAGLFSGKAPF